MKLPLLVLLVNIWLSVPAHSQEVHKIIESAANKLSKKKATISDVLTDSTYMHLHSLLSFRNLIKQYARHGKMTIAGRDEIGTKIMIKGIVMNLRGEAEAGKLIYIYQTSDKGWYADSAVHILANEGDRKHARLFGYLKTDSKGLFEFETIKPRGYPNSVLPGHIHLEVALDNENLLITELQFDDDPRLTGTVRSRSIREHFSIAKNEGTEKNPLYNFIIVTGIK